MRYTHHSETVMELQPTVYEQYTTGRGMYRMKPVGLWVSYSEEDGWSRWCERNGVYEESLRVVHELEVDEPNLRRVTNLAELNQLTEEFGVGDRFYNDLGIEGFCMDWRRMAEAYKGLMIFPYIEREWRSHNRNLWYYTWNCASGCIWDTSAIKSIRVVEGART